MQFNCLALLCMSFLMNSVAIAKGFDFPPNHALLLKGSDTVTGESCYLTIKSNAAGYVSYLSVETNFTGWAQATPAALTKTSHGFYGIANLIKGIAAEDFAYEPQVSSHGMTLSWSNPNLTTDKREAQLFGESLYQLERVVYSDHGPTLRLDGECNSLARLQVD